MQAGARISINENKKHPMDFVLWKGSKPGEPKWDSPWGPGRPGWHIECSAMSKKYFGDTFDIHGGGKDLIFPHHENEIAQSEAANNAPFVNMWIHHGFVTVRNEQTEETEKMSKSLGNFLTIRELSKRFHPEVLKLFVFSTQYRNPLEYSEQAMQDAQTGLVRLYECIESFKSFEFSEDASVDSVLAAKEKNKLSTLEDRFQQAMDNDFNTAQAIGILFDTSRLINKIIRKLKPPQSPEDIKLLETSISLLVTFGRIMGLLREPAHAFLNNRKNEILDGIDIDEETINKMITERYPGED